MSGTKSKYFGAAARMDEALIECLEKKDLAYITVKEICEKAGVNRSTFYLHYETIADLLDECVAYTNNKCFEAYSAELADVKKRIVSDQPEALLFISPAYLRPYLEFVRQNKRLYQVVLAHQDIFRTRHTFEELFNSVFSPALDRFCIPKEERAYIVHFYLGGITGIVREWLKGDCRTPPEQIMRICMRCTLPNGPNDDFLGAQSDSAP